MSYPRIFSLNTVGILKHYNQDFLFHEIRTDFTGNNGVGKSIIADLFQLIFIPHRDLIVFGTEGLKKADRQIHTLPYQCSEAYACLNIELKPDRFIVIGVCIPESKSRMLRSFIILNSNDDQGSLDEIGIPKNKLVTWRKFLKKDKIPPIEELSKHLRDKHDLYLTYYSYKEEKNNYYNFLYQKGLLPINLSIQDNLETFARIIQSFSRARSLDVNNSNSLKRFLFEDNEKQFNKLFLTHKGELERLLTAFKELKDFIEQLESKQADLVGLKAKEKKKIDKHGDFLQTELDYANQQVTQAEMDHAKSLNQLKHHENTLAALSKRAPKLQRLINASREQLEFNQEKRDILAKLRAEFIEYLSIRKSLKTLEHLKYPQIPEVIEKALDIAHFEVTEIERRINEVSLLFESYKSIAAMEYMCEHQKRLVDDRRSLLQNEIQKLEDVVQLIELGKDRTLFEQVIKAGKPLSAHQEAVLHSFLGVSWGKPDQVNSNSQYTLSLDLLNEDQIEKSESGFWLKLGHLNKFFPVPSGKRMFDNANNLKNAVKERLAAIKQLVAVNKTELSELDNFQRGRQYSMTGIKLDVKLDQRLLDFSRLEYYKESARMIQEIGNKISLLKNREQTLLPDVNKLTSELSDPTPENIDKKLLQLDQWVRNDRGRTDRLAKVSTQEEVKIDTLNSTLIPGQSEILRDKLNVLNKAKIHLAGKQTLAEQLFPDLKPAMLKTAISENGVEERRRLFDDAKLNYVTEYKTIAGRHEESRGRKNAEINEQIDDGLYDFNILEKVLLGTLIKHMDDIGNALTEANQQRLTMAETIHQTMLKIFSQTKTKYDEYRSVVRELNAFFKGKKISNRYYFQIQFKQHPEIDIDWIAKLQASSQRVVKRGELPFGDTVETYVEDFFKKVTNSKKSILFSDLLDPKTYFDLSVSLTNEMNKEIPGSTGETYSAIVLLGIGRLSIVHEAKRPGIRFIILEETANLDRVNFSTFPNIAQEFGYQIITMTPKPYGSDSEEGWYLHHMFPGIDNPDINYPDVASYFKTNESKKDLKTYLAAIKEE